MTTQPKDVDGELRERIADVFDELCEPTNQFWHRDSGLSWADKVMALIHDHTRGSNLEARLDEAKYQAENVFPTFRSWQTSEKILKRHDELKEQLKSKEVE